MMIEISEQDIKEIIRNNMKDDIELIIEEEMYEDAIRNAVRKALIEHIKSDEGQEQIKKSFKEYYIDDGIWTECDDVYEAVNERMAKIVENMFDQVKLVQK
jgi:hypothetical protein